MTEALDAATFEPIEGTDPALPGAPFSRLRYSYGQLLGAEDFAAEQKYHLLRARLRNALLHGTGVVAGLDVQARETIDPPAAELRCTAGLAIDALGREIYVPEPICLDVTGLAANARFWNSLEATPATADAPAEAGAGDGGDAAAPALRRRCYVILSYRACLSAQVPAIAAPCADADDALAWSRILDSYRLCVEAAAPDDPFETVRDWTRRSAPADLRARLQTMLTEVPADISRLFNHAEDVKVLLAIVDLEVVDERTRVVAVDTSVRALLPPVQSVAEMALGTRLAGPADPAAPAHFRALSADAASDGAAVTVSVMFSAPPQPMSVSAQSVHVLRFDPATGWTEPAVDNLKLNGSTLDVTLKEDWTVPTVWQVVLSGGGSAPIIDADAHPLAGFAGDPAPVPGRGLDAVFTASFTPA